MKDKQANLRKLSCLETGNSSLGRRDKPLHCELPAYNEKEWQR